MKIHSLKFVTNMSCLKCTMNQTTYKIMSPQFGLVNQIWWLQANNQTTVLVLTNHNDNLLKDNSWQTCSYCCAIGGKSNCSTLALIYNCLNIQIYNWQMHLPQVKASMSMNLYFLFSDLQVKQSDFISFSMRY